MILPNSTIQSSATVTDANGTAQTALTGTVTVSFPDGTTSAPLTPTNAGAGGYTLTYMTKGPGLHIELWSFGNRWSTDQAYSAGVWDAHTGNTIHVGCGGPASAALYLSGDWDFNTTTDGALVAAYFKGAASAIGLARIGAYGGYWLIKYLFDNGLITYGWQTYAWSGGLWEPRAHIQQYSNSVIMSGL